MLLMILRNLRTHDKTMFKCPNLFRFLQGIRSLAKSAEMTPDTCAKNGKVGISAHGIQARLVLSLSLSTCRNMSKHPAYKHLSNSLIKPSNFKPLEMICNTPKKKGHVYIALNSALQQSGKRLARYLDVRMNFAKLK